MKMSKRIGSIIIVAMLISMVAMNTIHVFAADAIVIDFSKNDDVMASVGGNGTGEAMTDGDKRVLFVECTDGYVPEDDPEGTGTLGDIYGEVADFADYGVDGSKHKWMKASIKNESAAPHFEIHFASPSSGYSVASSVSFDITPNSGYTEYVWNVEEFSQKYYPKRPADVEDPDNWPNHWEAGEISGLRLDFMYYDESGGHARTGDKIYVEYIAFFETEADANAFTFTPARTPAKVEEDKLAADAERAAAAAEREAAAQAAAEEKAAAEEAAAEEAAANQDSDDAAAEENGDADTETTTESSGSSDDDSNNSNMIIMILVAIAAIVVIIIVIVVLTSKSKKK